MFAVGWRDAGVFVWSSARGGCADQLHPDVDALLLPSGDAAVLLVSHDHVLHLLEAQHVHNLRAGGGGRSLRGRVRE
eukprot:6180147-Pleurochrysis_carterae.AAC.2